MKRAKRGAEDALIEGLIPGLVDNVALMCLLRVPRIDHGNIRGVCSRWKKLVDSRLFADERKRCGLTEEMIMLLPFWCYYNEPVECLEMDPSTGRVSRPIRYSMSKEAIEAWDPPQSLEEGSRFEGIGDRVLFFGFQYGVGEEEAGEEFYSRPCTMLELDTFDKTIKFAPDIPHCIDALNTEHAMINGKLWLDFPDDTYDVYDPETETWATDVEDVPPGWLFNFIYGGFNVLELFGYMPTDEVIRNLEAFSKDLRHPYYAVTSKGLFQVALGNYDSPDGGSVYKLDLSLPRKEQKGLVWTKLWGQDVPAMVYGLWKNRYLALKDTLIFMVPHDGVGDGADYRLEEVSSELKLLRVPEKEDWKVARILV